MAKSKTKLKRGPNAKTAKRKRLEKELGVLVDQFNFVYRLWWCVREIDELQVRAAYLRTHLDFLLEEIMRVHDFELYPLRYPERMSKDES